MTLRAGCLQMFARRAELDLENVEGKERGMVALTGIEPVFKP